MHAPDAWTHRAPWAARPSDKILGAIIYASTICKGHCNISGRLVEYVLSLWSMGTWMKDDG